LGHNGLELSLNKRYIEDLCVRWSVFEISLFGMSSAQLFKSAHVYALPQKSYVKYTKNRYYLATKTFLHFLTLLQLFNQTLDLYDILKVNDRIF